MFRHLLQVCDRNLPMAVSHTPKHSNLRTLQKGNQCRQKDIDLVEYLARNQLARWRLRRGWSYSLSLGGRTSGGSTNRKPVQDGAYGSWNCPQFHLNTQPEVLSTSRLLKAYLRRLGRAPPPPYLRHSIFDTFPNGVISAFTFYLPYTSVWGLWFKAFYRLVQQPNFNGDIGLHTKSNFNRLLLQEETRFFQYVFCIIHILPRALIVLWTKLG